MARGTASTDRLLRSDSGTAAASASSSAAPSSSSPPVLPDAVTAFQKRTGYGGQPSDPVRYYSDLPQPVARF